MSTPKGSVPWNAGTGKGWTDKRGYRWIYVTENGRRRAKREHRHVMEQHLRRALRPDEVVHHKNEDTADNRLENLEVLDWGTHTTSHHTGSHRSDLVKRTQEVMANYREEHKRLREINAELLAMLESLYGDLARYSKMTEGVWSSGSIAFGSMADSVHRVIQKALGREAICRGQ